LYLSDSSPKETAYIGDNYYTDVVGARQAGLYPILYDPRNIFPGADCLVISAISDLC
jgi:FMN phosphatase YigB (HAD superfamily)